MSKVDLEHVLELIQRHGEDCVDIFILPRHLCIQYLSTIPDAVTDTWCPEWDLAETFTEKYGDCGEDEYYEAWANFFNHCEEINAIFWKEYWREDQ